ncbi:DUF1659 domain-containing protein [Clostridium tetani]|uniref:DUF1659 domain-containing protein n=1 Tax=Clostridium tetani TaxID=1513 RepID=UPI00100C0F96|nr:DUF1659 domain-containing protein [Clostridium tetani]RXI78860.1 hypothetical protein DP128_00375 [Clostridium tetani]
MAITKDTYSTNLVLELDLGVDEKGKQKRKNKSLFKIAELEKWMIGKTVDEIKGMKVKKRDDNKNLLLG